MEDYWKTTPFYWMFKGAFMMVFFLGFIALVGVAVMSLWNALMPAIFGLTTISWIQAMGLLLLSKILFGGWPGGGRKGKWGKHRGRHHWRKRWEKKMANMSPEEKERWKKKFKGKCGGYYYRDAFGEEPEVQEDKSVVEEVTDEVMKEVMTEVEAEIDAELQNIEIEEVDVDAAEEGSAAGKEEGPFGGKE